MADKKKKQNSKKKTTTAAKKPSKQAKLKTKPAAKSAAKKPTAKSAPKRKRAVKAAKPLKSKTVPKKTETKKITSKKATNSKIKTLKPDRNFENGTDGESKIIIINGKKKADNKQTRRGRKRLKRVANIGGYTAWDGRTGKTFATEKEARDYAVDVFIRTGEIIPVTKTQRQVSHTFKAESKTEN